MLSDQFMPPIVFLRSAWKASTALWSLVSCELLIMEMHGPGRGGGSQLEPQHDRSMQKGCQEFETNLGYRENLSRKKEMRERWRKRKERKKE